MLLALLLSCIPKPAGLSELTSEHDALVLAWSQALDAGELAQLGPHLHPLSAQTLTGGFDQPETCLLYTSPSPRDS